MTTFGTSTYCSLSLSPLTDGRTLLGSAEEKKDRGTQEKPQFGLRLGCRTQATEEERGDSILTEAAERGK